jgi:anaerobic C4-dicarboxylate transporter
LIRTTKYHDAIDCVFVEYENGNAKPIGDAVSTSCYRTPCMITVEAKGNKLIAHAKTTAEYFITPNRPEVLLEMDLERTFTPNKFGGFGFQHTGTVGSGATLIKDLNIEWE